MTPRERMKAIGKPPIPPAEPPASARRLFGYLLPGALSVVVVSWGVLVQYAAGNADVQLGSVLCLALGLLIVMAGYLGRVWIEVGRPGGWRALRRVTPILLLLAVGPGAAMLALLKLNLLKGWMPDFLR